MLKVLIDVKGIFGNECVVRNVFCEYIELLVDSFEIDGLGSVVVKKVGVEDGFKIMIVGYLDEVGFMVM